MRKLPKSKPRSSKPREGDELKLMKRIGRRIHKDAYEQNFAQDRLAVEAEVSRHTLERIFKGEDNIGIITLHRVSKALGYKGIIDFIKNL